MVDFLLVLEGADTAHLATCQRIHQNMRIVLWWLIRHWVHHRPEDGHRSVRDGNIMADGLA